MHAGGCHLAPALRPCPAGLGIHSARQCPLFSSPIICFSGLRRHWLTCRGPEVRHRGAASHAFLTASGPSGCQAVPKQGRTSPPPSAGCIPPIPAVWPTPALLSPCWAPRSAPRAQFPGRPLTALGLRERALRPGRWGPSLRTGVPPGRTGHERRQPEGWESGLRLDSGPSQRTMCFHSWKILFCF